MTSSPAAEEISSRMPSKSFCAMSCHVPLSGEGEAQCPDSRLNRGMKGCDPEGDRSPSCPRRSRTGQWRRPPAASVVLLQQHSPHQAGDRRIVGKMPTTRVRRLGSSSNRFRQPRIPGLAPVGLGELGRPASPPGPRASVQRHWGSARPGRPPGHPSGCGSHHQLHPVRPRFLRR